MVLHQRTENGKKLEKYWREIRVPGKNVPARSEFRVNSGIASLLPFLVIVELADEDIVFRLIGTGLAEHQGIDITGSRYSDVAQPDQVARASRRFRAAWERPCGILSIHREDYGRGVSSTVELASFPLRGDNGEMMMVLSVTPIGKGLAEKSNTPLFLRPLTHIEYIDLGSDVPDDASIIAGLQPAPAEKG
ncbi:MAG: PAS domain-containing protein [Parvibaculum sp.]|nr:PAS domain-containing protein [Parvibaculum sp.]